MATKAARGLKRTCQNSECGSNFYDLNRDPIVCPMCKTKFVPVVHVPSAAAEERARKLRKPEVVATPVADPADGEVEVAEELVDLAVADEPVAAEADATFLEEEPEEGGDVTAIIGGVEGGEEEV
jgi:uncharacterized protein (TIGR02300 family)